MMHSGVPRLGRLRNSLGALILLAAPLQAEDAKDPIYGTWGTEAQCTGALLTPQGTKRAEPFEIRPGWLRHGALWCKLTWFPPQPRADGVFVSSRAQCGEDSVQGYRLDVSLTGTSLTLIWNESLINGPLSRCETPS